MKTQELTAIELFAGIGGFRLGLKVTIIVAAVSNVMKYKLKSQSLKIKGFTIWELTAEY